MSLRRGGLGPLQQSLLGGAGRGTRVLGDEGIGVDGETRVLEVELGEVGRVYVVLEIGDEGEIEVMESRIDGGRKEASPTAARRSSATASASATSAAAAVPWPWRTMLHLPVESRLGRSRVVE